MAQYTNSTTSAGFVVNAVLNSETNQIVYTVTAPNGAVATATGDADGLSNSIANQLTEELDLNGAFESLNPRALKNAVSSSLRNVSRNVIIQNRDSVATATATGESPPAEKQAIPPPANSDPDLPSPPTPEPVENTTPQYADFDQPVATEEEFYTPLQEPPGTQDEFSGIDEQVAANENALQEPPNIDPDEDPFEAARLQAEQENIESPTEQTVIDITDDPQLTKEEQDRLEAEQVANRAALQAEDQQDARFTTQGLTAKAQSKATKDDAVSFQKKPDWRVRLSLSPGANYLYKVGDGQAGILNPLQKTDGVIFPYTPSVSVTYTAGYDSSDIVHSNYKVFQYKGSSVDNLQITGEFTAQDTNEANYLLAVIHFFRSVTKMFYGQDQNPKNGVPPPLLYLSGLGTYQYDAHPLAITNFTYSLPTDVDYIRAGSQTNQPGQNLAGQQTPVNTNSLQQLRTVLNKLKPASPVWSNQQSLINSEATYVPTKMQIQLTAIPIVTRNDISNNFSLAKYATGELLRGTKRSGGGIW